MNDNEIVKALECCAMGSYPACRECPYHDQYINRNCIAKRNDDIKDLINRQQAEIEKLNKARQKQAVFLGEEREQKYELIDKLSKANTEIERLRAEADMAEGYADALVARAKSEAIKEFAERFRKELFDEIQKTIWNIDVPLEYEQNKSYVLARVWSCIKNKLEELVGD